ncbi:MAG TPA: amino acid adenylation domain-containing protein [Thermoanaerobaculia bacterium]|nr:amino acid adenylation domain-containing protein [Thermoanaerobaculia bacterium]
MSAAELLFRLRDLGVEVWNEGEKLRLNAPMGVLTPELRTELSDHKAEILSFLDRAARSAAEPAPAPPIEPVPRQGRLPLSFAQQRLWFLEQLQPGSPVYHVPAAFRLDGRLSVPALAAAFSGVVARHEALRTSFPAVEGEPVQEVAPRVPMTLPLVDLSGVPGEQELERLVRDEARLPFDLARGPLFRCTLVRLAPERHACLVTLHHIVSDAWSLGILVRELPAFYRAARTGEATDLPPLPVQYADFAHWQRQWLAGEVLASELAWWRERLAGAPPVLELPSDRPRPAVRSSRGEVRSVHLPAGISMLARAEGATLFMALLAGFLALLHRTTRETDLPIGTPIAGRNRMETEGLIGFFVNTLVVRGDLGGDPTFRQFLGRVREASLEAFRHQDLPFEKLVEELRPERSLSHTPLFQVMFAVQNVPVGPLDLEGLTLTPLPLTHGISKFDLLLTLAEAPEGITGTLEHSSDLFEAATAERLMSQLERLLAGAMEEPGTRVSSLPLLSAPERQQLLVEWTDARTATPRDGLLHELFETQADRTPDAVAAVFGDLSLSYGELEARANQVAHRLRRRGVGLESLVGLNLERSLELVIGVYGILKAGAAYVPLDPEYPRERLLLMMEGVAVTLTSEGWPEIVREDRSRPVSGVTGGNAAYVMYTSGSTGRPKGVVIRHGGITSHMHWMERDFPLDGQDCVLQKTPISFDASVWEFYAALMSGGRLALVRPGGHREPGYLADEIERHQVTVFQVVPSLLRAFLGEPELERRCRSLRWLICGGETLGPEVVERFFERLPGRLVNVYGPAEGSITATWCLCRPGEAVSIGRAIANAEIHMLDPALEPVPMGVAGELCLGGAGVGRGYLNRPELTAERFIPHPFGAPGERLYRTGDLARWTADGRLFFLGRLDHQVKVRGVRVEPGEVEAALLQHPGIREAAVVVRKERLAAYVVPRTEPPSHLREYLLERLPEPMVPSWFMVLERLPLNPSGKVDRKALPLPEVSIPARSYIAPRTPAEEVVAGIWAEVLGLSRVGIEDNFFELGGHSLLAVQVVSRVRQAFGVELPLRDLFEAPTVAGLAARLEESEEGEEERPAPSIRKISRDLPLPLSFAQRRLWFIDQLQPGSPAYNIPSAFRLRGLLRLPVLAAVLTEIVRRHEVLRTTFPAVEGEPFQTVAPPRPVPLPVVDLSGLAPERREREMELRIAEEARRPFTLDRDPMLRVHLLRLEAGENALVAVVHHIASDGWSVAVLVRELVALYRAFADGRPSPLADLPIQYADFAVWQRDWLRGEVLEREVAGWRERLGDASPVLELPTDRPRPAVRRHHGAVLPLRLPRRVSEELASLARQEGATLFMALLAGFRAFLARLTGQEDLSVGTPVAGRNRVETEGLVGLFVNTLALRGDLGGDPAVRELLARSREATLEAFRHQELPFEKLVEELHPDRSLGVSPLFQVMLVFQNLPRETLELPGLTLSPLAAESGAVKLDLVLTLAEEAGEVFGSLQYDTDLFDRATAERLAGGLATLLGGFHPERRLGELPLLPDAERREVLHEWSRGQAGSGRAVCLHELFAAQVEKTPDAVALSFEDFELSYRALSEQALSLACRLRGAGPDVPVGICLERSPEMVIAILAVLEAGGAYLPLDPAHPKAHLDAIMEEARPALVLTRDAWPEAMAEFPATPANPRSLAYVIYTSGSTGRPKGVMIPHGAIANHLLSRQALHPLDGGDRFLQQAPFSFEMSVWEIFAPLTAGARLVLARPGGQGDARYLVETIWKQGITALRFTPSMLRVILDEPGVEACRSLRLLFSGAEPFPVELRDRLLPGIDLQYLYGPTETCVAASLLTGAVADGRLPIGRAIAGAELYTLDRWLEPVPVGVPGELYIGGVNLARGYLKRPDLAAERFVPHPFAAEPGARLYRTGDRVRWRPDGRLEFLGRVDYQLKVRGFRLEPGEVEAALVSHPAVREAVVLMHETLLVAYVGADADHDWRRFLQERLPEFMVPAVFVRLEALPRTRNGKVDRQALPAPDLRTRPDGYVAPRSQTEELIAAIWSQVMGIGEVGVRDDFFALGGHSLLATRVVSRLRQAFGVELPLRTLFESPTVAGLAEAVERRDVGTEPAPPVVPVPRDGRLPLSFAQQRLWFLEQFQPGSTVYHVPAAFRLKGRLSIPALAAALSGVVARHEALRTVFPSREGEPVQVVVPSAPVPLPVVDLSGLPDRELERLIQEEVRRPFDLARGPLFRCILVRLAPESHAALVTMHHIVSDAWSLGLLVRELAVLYRGEVTELPPLPVQYADFAHWQRQRLAGEALASELAWWRERLAGAPPVLELPSDRPRPAVRSPRGAVRSLRLAADISTLARAEGATLFMTLLAGFFALLHRTTGETDLPVGTPIAGRNRVETEGLIGFFVNTLVVRGDLGGAPTFRQLLSRVRETSLEAFRHQDLPFEKLVEELRPERSLSHTPLFQVMFAVQNVPVGSLDLEGLTLAPLPLTPGIAKFDLLLTLAETPAGIAGTLEYSTDLFEAATAERLLGQMERLLAGAVEEPGARVSSLPLLSAPERQQLLVEWTDARTSTPRDGLLHELFEAQADRSPDAVAAVFDDLYLSYGELEARANQVAHYFRRRGVGLESLVGLSLERSLELVIGVYGILKAGAAYVPLDPEYPRERLLLMSEGVSAVLTSEGWLEIAREDRSRPVSGVTGENAAYVMYTSGSTGRPKGVVIRHGGITSHMHWMDRDFPLDGQDCVLQKTPISFDASIWEFYAALMSGGRLALARPGGHREPGYLADEIERHQVTVFQVVPSLLRAFLEEPELERRCRSLRWLICGGEALGSEVVERFFERLPGRLVNVYGPAEGSITATWWLCRPGEAVSIGRPIANAEIHLLDPALEAVPVGVAGELCLGGAGVGRGYLNRPELTAERFIPHPSGAPGERLYRTGDLARWTADGRLFFLGRLDHQVKVRGVRVEPGEVEAALLLHPGIREAAVVVRRERLAAYVVPRAEPPSHLREYLLERLPEPMVPSWFMVLERLPLNPSGKVDRKALPAPEVSIPERSYVAPRTPAEEVVVGIWAEVLGLPKVGILDNFFELGGHSLLATQVVSRVRQAFGVELPLRELFETPTVAGIAESLDAALWHQGGAAPAAPAEEHEEIEI